jgi:hypothetical protein
MTDVTLLLSAIEHGDPSAAETLLPLVYDEWRRLAAEQSSDKRWPARSADAQMPAAVGEICLAERPPEPIAPL